MGIYKSYDTALGKWKWQGFRLVKYYNTEAEADADRENVVREHWQNVRAWNILQGMLHEACLKAQRRIRNE